MIIPFFIPHSGCPHQCVFCNQKNITGQKQPVAPSSIPGTIDAYLTTAPEKAPVQVAFYGGSFTALPQETQKTYLEAVRPFIDSGRIESIRLSTRPDCISADILELLLAGRVRTVELGAQSLDDRVLLLSGRGHRAEDTVRAVAMLKDFGMETGVQLMPGLPGDSETIFSETVARVIALRPSFVRLYPALVIKGTPLAELYREGRYKPLSLDEATDRCSDALRKFAGAGIGVIRIGLQPTEELEKPGTILAGPYHPAFRQLVESSLLLGKMKELLEGPRPPDAAVTFFVHPRDLSAAVGQKRSNIAALKSQYGLQTVQVRADESLSRRTVKLSGGK